MIDANRKNSLERRDSMTVVIEGEEDLTVVDNPPGFPSPEELEFVGVGDLTTHVEIGESEKAEK